MKSPAALLSAKAWPALAALCLVALARGPGLAADPEPTRGLTAVARPLGAAERAGEKVDPDGSAGLFVGVGAFEDNSGLERLNFTPDDAVALAHLFTLELQLLPPAHTRVAISTNPASRTALQFLAELKAAGVAVVDARRNSLLDALDDTVKKASSPDGLVVVSFGSHGFEEKGTAYIMPSDGRRKYVGTTGLSVQSVKDTLREARANKRILVLDACRETLGTEVRGEQRMNPALRDALRASEGFAIVASCGAGQLSWESPEFRQGVFTHFLLEAVRGGAGADAPDGLIRLGDASAYATRATRDWVRAQKREVQEPWFEGELARSIPLAVHPEALRRRETVREANARLDARRQEARRLLALAVAEDSENQLPADALASVRSTLDRVTGRDLEELLGELEALAQNTPRNRRIFAQYWKDRRAALGAPAGPVRVGGVVLAPLPSTAPSRPLVADSPATNRSGTEILDSLRLPETPKPTNARVRPLGLALALRAHLPEASATHPWTNEFGMPFVPVPGTRVLMCAWETPRSVYRVHALVDPTVATHWQAPAFVGGQIPTDGRAPVVQVNWADARKFCEWLTLRGRLNGKLTTNQLYRLPTDVEWSRAVGLADEVGATPAERGENAGRHYPWGDDFPPKKPVGNYRDTSATALVYNAKLELGDYRDGYPTLSPVGAFPPNALGIHDLGGNVAEMCEDLYRPGGKERVVRGGTWLEASEAGIRSGARKGWDPEGRNNVTGFRVVLAGRAD